MNTDKTITRPQRWQTIVLSKRPGCWQLLQIPIPEQPVVHVRTPRTRTIPLCDQPYKDSDPLATFVTKAGGINPDYAHGMRHGEIAKIRELQQGVPPGAINHHASLTLEEMAEYAFGHGYIFEPTIDAFLDALEQDVNACATGNQATRVYSSQGKETILVDVAWRQYNDTFADDGRETA